jgi:hypothetical protein
MPDPPPLRPTADFNWTAVSWGGPDEPPPNQCSYCDAPIPEGAVALLLWNPESWCATFCNACQTRYWGLQGLDDGATNEADP